MERNDYSTKIWLDFLCWESALKILLFRGLTIKVIYYCQASTLFLPFISSFRKITGISFVPVVDFIAAEEHIGDNSAFETIHIRIKEILGAVSNKWTKDRLIREFIRKKNFDLVKIREHLKEAAFYSFYRPVEISIVAEVRSNKENDHFFFRQTPFSEILSEELGIKFVHFYTTCFSHLFAISKRENHIYDKTHSTVYYADRFLCIGKLIVYWLLNTIKAIMASGMFLRGKTNNCVGTNIGIDFSQRQFRFDEINDFFWLDQSEISPKTVYGIELHNIDSRSEDNLAKLDLYRAKPIRLLNFLKDLFLNRVYSKSNVLYFAPDIMFVRQSMWLAVTLLQNLFGWNEKAWIRFQLAKFSIKSFYWNSVYKQLNIRILSSTVDFDTDKLAKAQALEMRGGFFVGTFWGLYPILSVYNQKCYDILFTWGDHFVKNIFNSYPSFANYVVGYAPDYCFEKQTKRALEMRSKYTGKFILSYMNNIMGNDVPYSLNMQLSMYGMLLNVLEENDNVILFLKPKKNYMLDKVIRENFSINDLVESGRIVLFLGEGGTAREVAAILNQKLILPEKVRPLPGDSIHQRTSVSVDAPKLCPRYAARLIENIKVVPSPFWLQERIRSVGLRPINNIVDITNFVLMEYGQPLHAFDFDRLSENRIVVRAAHEGETFTTLDEKERRLSKDMLMICDGQKPVAIGGVMGGLNSEIEPDTSNVLLESAYFNPASIRKTSKNLGLNTDA